MRAGHGMLMGGQGMKGGEGWGMGKDKCAASICMFTYTALF